MYEVYCIYTTILSYFLKYKNNTESKNPRVPNISKARIMILSKCEMFNSKKTIFIKEQEASGVAKPINTRTSVEQDPSKYLNVLLTLLLVSYDVATSNNVKSTLKQHCVCQRWNLQPWATSNKRCLFPYCFKQR